MGRGSRATRRWENDRQRKKKERAKKKAAETATDRRGSRA
jgi:hypothetical protein